MFGRPRLRRMSGERTSTDVAPVARLPKHAWRWRACEAQVLLMATQSMSLGYRSATLTSTLPCPFLARRSVQRDGSRAALEGERPDPPPPWNHDNGSSAEQVGRCDSRSLRCAHTPSWTCWRDVAQDKDTWTSLEESFVQTCVRTARPAPVPRGRWRFGETPESTSVDLCMAPFFLCFSVSAFVACSVSRHCSNHALEHTTRRRRMNINKRVARSCCRRQDQRSRELSPSMPQGALLALAPNL